MSVFSMASSKKLEVTAVAEAPPSISAPIPPHTFGAPRKFGQNSAKSMSVVAPPGDEGNPKNSKDLVNFIYLFFSFSFSFQKNSKDCFT
jgi:hypothetical protein